MILTKSKIYEKNLISPFFSAELFLQNCIYPKIEKYYRKKFTKPLKSKIDIILLKKRIEQKDLNFLKYYNFGYVEVVLKHAVCTEWLSLISFISVFGHKRRIIDFCIHYIENDYVKKILKYYGKGENIQKIIKNFEDEDGYIEGIDYWIKDSGKICWK